jgi:DNA mismatch repair protein MutS2
MASAETPQPQAQPLLSPLPSPLPSDDPELRTLEWNRLLELGSAQARTVPGRNRLLELMAPKAWAPHVEAARTMQQETQEAGATLDRESFWGPLTGLGDPAFLLERLGKGAALELPELAELRRWLYVFEAWGQVPREEFRGERFRRDLGRLLDPYAPLKELDRLLTPEGELSESASPRIAALHAEIRRLRREISAVLDQVIKAWAARGVLQEAFSDFRDGRYVVPVRISAQNDVDGNIYDVSASRQSVFVEPREVALLNNRLRQRQNELIQEIDVLLQEISARLRPLREEIESSVGIVTHWDCVHAKARLGRRFGGKTIFVGEDQEFLMRQTAHPLLWWSLPAEAIVRNEIDFSEPAQALLLTGPNTGGKTVLLKTLGLAGICARTGFPFPATETPKVPFFESFFIDLGDPQSIEAQLSSFSGRILGYRRILERVSDRSLVLIDELNSATDPEEGAALGRAFLETILARGARVVATTHDPQLKALASGDRRILNASMEFSEEARTPTYRILVGVPGRSHALETAERLGIPASVLAIARGYLSAGHQAVERLLSRLESDVQEAAKARRTAVTLQEEAEKLKQEWTRRTGEAAAEMLERARSRLRKVLEQAQDEIRASVRRFEELRGRKGAAALTRGELDETLRSATGRIDSALKEEAPELAEQLARRAAEAETSPPEPLELKPGSVVRVAKWKSLGTVLEIAGERVKVALGTLQITLSRSDLEAANRNEARQLKAAEAKKLSRVDGESASAPVLPPAPKLDLRGQRYEEAKAELERYLDQAYRSGSFAEVTIVHGLGTGALREGTRQLLAGLPYVKAFRDAGAGQGGSGATLVEFERA